MYFYFLLSICAIIASLSAMSEEMKVVSNSSFIGHSQYNITDSIDVSKVVIILSHGRSGSSELCLLVSNLVGGGDLGAELFGKTSIAMLENKNPLQHMKLYIHEQQKRHPQKYAGFKWKPYYHDDNYQLVWNWVAQYKVKVVFNYRNPLDVVISSTKHALNESKSNCVAHNSKCMDLMKSLKFPLVLDFDHLHTLELSYAKVALQLVENNVTFFDTRYEDLNYGDPETRLHHLQLLADFVNPGRKVTMEDFEIKLGFSGNYHQADTITNFAEVVASLKGTRYARFIH